MTRILEYIFTCVQRIQTKRICQFRFQNLNPKGGFGYTLVYSMKLQKCNFVCDLSWLGYQNIYSLVFGIFEPKAIRIPDALKLLLDDFGEQRSRTVVRFKHPTHVDVHVILEKNSILLQKLFWPTVRKNCSSDQEIFLRSLEQFIQTVKGQNNFWLNRMLF